MKEGHYTEATRFNFKTLRFEKYWKFVEAITTRTGVLNCITYLY